MANYWASGGSNSIRSGAQSANFWGGSGSNSIQTGARRALKRTPAPAATGPQIPGMPASTATALPPDATYEQQLAAFAKRRDDQIAALKQQQQAGLLNYGYSQDAQGNLAFDPANPNSQAALMLKHYQQAKKGTGTSYAARGQLYSGALLNAQNANDSGYQAQDDALRKALLSFLAQTASKSKDAANQYELDAAQAEAERLARAAQSPSHDPSTGAGGNPAATGPGPALTPQQADPANWVVTTYTNNHGHKVNVYGDGSKKVLVNGVWKKV